MQFLTVKAGDIGEHRYVVPDLAIGGEDNHLTDIDTVNHCDSLTLTLLFSEIDQAVLANGV